MSAGSAPKLIAFKVIAVSHAIAGNYQKNTSFKGMFAPLLKILKSEHSDTSRTKFRFLLVAAANLGSAAAGFLFFSIVARSQGAGSMGRLALAMTVLVFAQIATNFGSDSIAIRTAALRPQSTRTMVSTVVAFRLIALIPVALIALGAMSGTRSLMDARELLLILIGSMIANARSPVWVAQAFELQGVAALFSIGSALLALVIAVILFFIGARVPAFAVARVVADTIGAICLLFWIIRRVKPTWRWEISDVLNLAKSSAPVGFSKLANGFGPVSDLLIVGYFTTSIATGFYAGAARVLSIMLTLTVLYGNVIFPQLARSSEAGGLRLRETVTNSLRLTLPAAAAGAFAIAFLAPLALVAAFGRDFSAGAGVLRLFCAAAVVNLAGRTFAISLIAAGYAKVEMKNTLTTTAAGIAIKVILIFNYGLIGAAGAYLIVECLAAGLQFRSLRRVTAVNFTSSEL